MPVPYAARPGRSRIILATSFPVQCANTRGNSSYISITLGYIYAPGTDSFRHGDADLPRVLEGELRSSAAHTTGSDRCRIFVAVTSPLSCRRVCESEREIFGIKRKKWQSAGHPPMRDMACQLGRHTILFSPRWDSKKPFPR